MEAIVRLFDRIVHEEDGQDMVEYALILGLISIVAVLAVSATGVAVSGIWTAVETAVEDAAAAV